MINDVRSLVFSSDIPIDKVLATFSGSFSAPAGTSANAWTDTNRTFNTGIPETTLFAGIYSVDGGATWNDMGTSVYSGITELFSCIGRSNSNQFTVMVRNFYNYNNNTGTARTVLYKVVLLEKPDQGEVSAGTTHSSIYFDSRENYQKIAVDDARNISVSNNTISTVNITHSLGYIPRVRCFIQINSTFAGLPAGLYSFNSLASRALSVSSGHKAPVSMTNTLATVEINNRGGAGNFSARLYTRIYYDS